MARIPLGHVVTITLDSRQSERYKILTALFNYAAASEMEFDSDELNASNTITVGFAFPNSREKAMDFKNHISEILTNSSISDPVPIH